MTDIIRRDYGVFERTGSPIGDGDEPIGRFESLFDALDFAELYVFDKGDMEYMVVDMNTGGVVAMR